jgi:hypothetical protein
MIIVALFGDWAFEQAIHGCGILVPETAAESSPSVRRTRTESASEHWVCTQFEGPCTYVARWFIDGQQVGVPLPFTATIPRPATQQCIHQP